MRRWRQAENARERRQYSPGCLYCTDVYKVFINGIRLQINNGDRVVDEEINLRFGIGINGSFRRPTCVSMWSFRKFCPFLFVDTVRCFSFTPQLRFLLRSVYVAVANEREIGTSKCTDVQVYVRQAEREWTPIAAICSPSVAFDQVAVRSKEMLFNNTNAIRPETTDSLRSSSLHDGAETIEFASEFVH